MRSSKRSTINIKQPIKPSNRQKKTKLQSHQGSSILQSGSYGTLQKAIIIQFDNFTQIFPPTNLSPFISEQNNLLLSKLLSYVSSQYNIFLQNKLIKFYLEEGDVYLTIIMGNYQVFIDYHDFVRQNNIKLQIFEVSSLIDVVMQQVDDQSENSSIISNSQDQQQDQLQNQNLNSQYKQQNQQDQKLNKTKRMIKQNNKITKDQGKCRRLKQRKIKHVIQKVLKWRQLYAGIDSNNQNTQQKVPLEDGAKIVKISKKTLDDYLSQIKKGHKYGFNFNDHKNQKVGVLRQFIRKMEKQQLIHKNNK